MDLMPEEIVEPIFELGTGYLTGYKIVRHLKEKFVYTCGGAKGICNQCGAFFPIFNEDGTTVSCDADVTEAIKLDMLKRADKAPANGWQTMDTAPRDGTYIFVGFRSPDGYWNCDMTKWDGDGWWQHRQRNPTHWMPLPTPPQDKKE